MREGLEREARRRNTIRITQSRFTSSFFIVSSLSLRGVGWGWDQASVAFFGTSVPSLLGWTRCPFCASQALIFQLDSRGKKRRGIELPCCFLTHAMASLIKSLSWLASGALIMLKWLPGICRVTRRSPSTNSSHMFGPKSDRFSNNHCAWPYG